MGFIMLANAFHTHLWRLNSLCGTCGLAETVG